MSKASSRSERKLHDENDDSKPPAVQRTSAPEQNPSFPSSPSMPDGFHKRMNTPPVACQTPRTQSAATRRPTSMRPRPRLAVEESDGPEDDRPIKPPPRKLSSYDAVTAHDSDSYDSHQLNNSRKAVPTSQASLPLNSELRSGQKNQLGSTHRMRNEALSPRSGLDAFSMASIQSIANSDTDGATTCTVDLVLAKRYRVLPGQVTLEQKIGQEQTPQSLNSRLESRSPQQIEAEKSLFLDDSVTALTPRYKGQEKSRQVPGGVHNFLLCAGADNREKTNRHFLTKQTFTDSVSRNDSLSTVPDPPSLHQGGHYSQPGAFRMRSGGMLRSADLDSVASSIRSLITSRTHKDQVIEASLVEDFVPDDECPSPPAPANYSVSVDELTHMTVATTASPIVEAHPLDESHTFRAFFRNRKVQFVVSLLASIFVILVLGTIYGITGFENVIDNPAPMPETPGSIPSLAPTAQGGVNFDSFFHEALQDYTAQALRRENSPQSKALAWLQNNTLLETYPLSRRLQRFALATLFYSTGGDRRWTNNSGWLSDNEECSWYSGNTESPICAKGQYRELSLEDNSLRGTIPPEISLLKHLDVLEMPRNILTGFLPTALQEITGLREIRLFDNYLSGTVPSEIGSLDSLEVFDVEFNFVAQVLPETLGGLANLRQLLIDRNLLVGSLPTEYGSLTRLEAFYAYVNGITGSIPIEFGNLSNLRDVRFEVNSISGTLTSAIGSWTKIVDLSLGNNTLSGKLPTEIGRCRQLTYLDIFKNGFTGTLPTELGLLVNADRFYFEDNYFIGNIPSEIGELKNLTRLWMHLNTLTGSIPTQLGDLSYLRNVDLSNNRLSGKLPPQLGNLSSIKILYLENNLFTGTIPSELGQLTDLTILALHGNMLTGEMPTEICSLVETGSLSSKKLTVNCSMVKCTCCNCAEAIDFSDRRF